MMVRESLCVKLSCDLHHYRSQAFIGEWPLSLDWVRESFNELFSSFLPFFPFSPNVSTSLIHRQINFSIEARLICMHCTERCGPDNINVYVFCNKNKLWEAPACIGF